MSGQTLAEFFRERIFDPLKMTDTHFYVPTSKLDRFAALYHPGDDGKIVLPRPEKVMEQPIAVARNSLGMCSDR